MAYKKIEIQDYAGIKFYPKTTADIVVTSSGETLESVAAKANGASNPNLLINGGFNFLQRGTKPFSVGATTTYTADRWAAYAIGGGTATAEKLDAGVISLTGKYAFLVQAVEPLPSFDRSKPYTFSVDLKRDSGNTGVQMGIALKDTISGDWIYQDQINANAGINEWNRVSITSSGLDQYTANYLMVYIKVNAPSVGTIYARRAKLEQGSVATPYVPEDYTLELLRCMRYYRRPKMAVTTLPRITDHQYLLLDHWFNVPMRGDPTVTLYEPGNIYGPGNPEGYKFGDEGWGAPNHVWIKGNTGRTGFKRVSDIGATEEKIDALLLADSSGVAGNSYYFRYEADAEIY